MKFRYKLQGTKDKVRVSLLLGLEISISQLEKGHFSRFDLPPHSVEHLHVTPTLLGRKASPENLPRINCSKSTQRLQSKGKVTCFKDCFSPHSLQTHRLAFFFKSIWNASQEKHLTKTLKMKVFIMPR